MRSSFGFILSVGVLLPSCFLSAPLSAQVSSGSIEGWLTDAEGNPVPYANVVVSGPHLQGVRGAVAQDDGHFLLQKLPVGSYTLKISHISFKPAEIPGVQVRLGGTTSVGWVVLAELVHEMEPVVVVADAEVINPVQIRTGGSLVAEELSVLPLTRDYQDIATLLPEVNASFLGDGPNYGGATGLENRYFVDGIEVTDPYRGVGGTQLPYNFVRGVEVRSGIYQAEYRGSLGGAIDVVTQSGSNELHGSVFGFYANNQLAGDPRLGIDQTRTGQFSLWDIGGNLYGPLLRDKLWFNIAYNPLVRREEVRLPGDGTAMDKTVVHRLAGGLSWRPSGATSLNLRMVGDPNSRDGVGERLMVTFTKPETLLNPDPYLGDISTSSLSSAVQFQWDASKSFLFEANASVLWKRDMYVPSTAVGAEELNFTDLETLTESGGYPTNTDNRSTYSTLLTMGTWRAGAHTVKGGLGFRDNFLNAQFHFSVLSRTDDPASPTGDHFYWVTQEAEGSLHNRGASVFLQDSWRVGRQWRINAGLRWDSQFWINSRGETVHEILDEWQPRVGVSYQLGTPGSHQLFASAGRFYQDLSTTSLAFLLPERILVDFTECFTDPRADNSTCVPYPDPTQLDPSVKGQYTDEFTLGYEGNVVSGARGVVKGVFRNLGRTIEDGAVNDPNYAFVWGNPGSGRMAEYPEARRKYYALVLGLETMGKGPLEGRASYVLSRNEGNYPGLYNSDYGIPFPNSSASYDYPDLLINGDGLLPNDRTHVLKLSGAFRTNFGLVAGAFLQFASGTPRSLIEGWYPPYFLFAEPRGTYGRTASIWDVNLRFTYDLSRAVGTATRPLLILDLFHVASQQEAVQYDDLKNFAMDDDGNPIAPNPTFGEVDRFQPPMAMRLGLEVGF